MKTEIERKFLVRELPDLSNLSPKHYERYYVQRDDKREVRVQRVDGIFEKETKEILSNLERTTEKEEISESEFNNLKQRALTGIVRDSYLLETDPDISVKIYHGKFEGLVRAEVEFDSVEKAKQFESLEWMGKEITDLPLGRDSLLLDLNEQEFYQLLTGKDK